MGNETFEPGKLESLRREYSRKAITKENVQDDPFDQFSAWFDEAMESDVTDANAMTLATADSSGQPSSRIVLLKGFDSEGFRFYTNYESRKGHDLKENPKASLNFFWPALERQICIRGSVKKLSREESEAYFKTRPRDSQLGAWASSQSSEVRDRQELENKLSEVSSRFEQEEVPIPDFWGGYILRPDYIEFWQGRPGRLHDRILYTRESGGDWKIKRLSP